MHPRSGYRNERTTRHRMSKHKQELTMRTIKKSKLKKAIIAIEARRSKRPDAPRLKVGQDFKLQRIRQTRDKILVEFLRAGGLDTRKVAALGKQHDAALRRVIDKY